MNRKNKILSLIITITFIITIACASSTEVTKVAKQNINTIAPKATSTPIPPTKIIKTNTPKNTSTPLPVGYATVVVELCNLRKGPGTNYPTVGSSAKNEVLTIYGINKEKSWLLIDKDKSIWIALSLVNLNVETSSIPMFTDLASLENYEPPKSTKANSQMGIISTQSVGIPEPTQSVGISEPTQFAGCPIGCTFHPPGCDIKGNISYKTGEKIYHLPNQEFYSETEINPDYGERWFCTEQEAINNGWRKSNN